MENSRYKFRAWDKKQNKMIHPFYIGGDGEGHVIPAINDSSDTLCSDSVLMQCTGLLDKNGKEIFEGDILLCREMHDSNVFGHAWKNVWTKNNPGHSVAIPQIIKQNSPIDWDIPEDISYHPNWWEIIGNIHENHELLEANP